jgi:YD repeat-containing protein
VTGPYADLPPLNRLISAATTGPECGHSFGYDGFGDLLSQAVTKGSTRPYNREILSACISTPTE